MDKLFEQSKLIKKDLFMVIGLVIIFLALLIGLYFYDAKTGILASLATNLYSFLIK